MSRRFGRNQRRRMREELAAKESAVSSLHKAMSIARALLAEQSSKISRMLDWVQDVRDMVGPFAIAAGEPLHDEYMLASGTRAYRVGVQQPASATLCSGSEFSVSIASEMHIETMRLLEVKFIGDAMRAQMHCMVRLDDGDVAYAISDSALRRMSDVELEKHFLPHVAEKLSRLLARRIAAARRGSSL